jgi:hypothetical protein
MKFLCVIEAAGWFATVVAAMLLLCAVVAMVILGWGKLPDDRQSAIMYIGAFLVVSLFVSILASTACAAVRTATRRSEEVDRAHNARDAAFTAATELRLEVQNLKQALEKAEASAARKKPAKKTGAKK